MTDYMNRRAEALRQDASRYRSWLPHLIAAWRGEHGWAMRPYRRFIVADTIKTIRIKEGDAAKWEAMS